MLAHRYASGMSRIVRDRTRALISKAGKVPAFLRQHGGWVTARKAASVFADELRVLRRQGAQPSEGLLLSSRGDIGALLGLEGDVTYANDMRRTRDDIVERLTGCSPGDAFPGEMVGYLGEAALRFARTLDAVARHVPVAGSHVLEVGSNPYFMTILLHEAFRGLRYRSVNYFGGDQLVGTVQRQSVRDPRGRLTSVEYHYADIERDPLDIGSAVDVCLFCEVIEHLIGDPAWALYNLARQLRPGGIMILSTPNPARLENIERLVWHRGSFSDPISGYGIHGRHNREYTVEELIGLLRGTGFEIVNVGTIDVVESPYSKAAERAGYGQYILVEARLSAKPTLRRPPWLYRSFAPEQLASPDSLARLAV